jgi:hypothetical protein
MNARVLLAQVADADDCSSQHKEVRGQRLEIRNASRRFEILVVI